MAIPYNFYDTDASAKPVDRFLEIRRLVDRTVAVDGDIISFDPETKHKAGLIVNVAAFRDKQPQLSH